MDQGQWSNTSRNGYNLVDAVFRSTVQVRFFLQHLVNYRETLFGIIISPIRKTCIYHLYTGLKLSNFMNVGISEIMDSNIRSP